MASTASFTIASRTSRTCSLSTARACCTRTRHARKAAVVAHRVCERTILTCWEQRIETTEDWGNTIPNERNNQRKYSPPTHLFQTGPWIEGDGTVFLIRKGQDFFFGFYKWSQRTSTQYWIFYEWTEDNWVAVMLLHENIYTPQHVLKITLYVFLRVKLFCITIKFDQHNSHYYLFYVYLFHVFSYMLSSSSLLIFYLLSNT